MPDRPIPEDEPGAEERFDRAIKRALATPPTPHAPSQKSATQAKIAGAKTRKRV